MRRKPKRILCLVVLLMFTLTLFGTSYSGAYDGGYDDYSYYEDYSGDYSTGYSGYGDVNYGYSNNSDYGDYSYYDDYSGDYSTGYSGYGDVYTGGTTIENNDSSDNGGGSNWLGYLLGAGLLYSVFSHDDNHSNNTPTPTPTPDTTPPNIIIPVNNPYKVGDVYTVYAQITDTGSGVNTSKTRITFDGNTVHMGDKINLTLGTHTVSVYAEDNAGNSNTAQAQLIVICGNTDKTPPVINIPLNNPYQEGTIYTVNVQITDADSDVDTSKTKITFDGNTVTQGQNITLTYGNGYHIIYVEATDKAGNTAAMQATLVVIRASSTDTTPPVINIPLNNPYQEGTVYTVNVQITDSGSGINASKTKITFDGNTVTQGQNITLTYGNGYHTIYAEATDNAGNTAHAQAVLVVTRSNDNCDTTPPYINIPLNNPYQEGTVYTVNVQIADSGSGINASKTKITFDGNTVTQGQNITLTYGNGYHTIYAEATDNAGNTAHTQATLVVTRSNSCDTTPPVIVIPVNNIYYVGDYYYFSNIQVTDADSGVDTVTITYDGTTVSQSQNMSLTLGTHTIYVVARDKAGNVANKTATLYVVNNNNGGYGPTINIPINGTYSVGSNYIVNVQVTAGSSPIQSTTITFDGNTVYQGQSVRISTAGSHTIYATATDTAGRTANKSAVLYANGTIIYPGGPDDGDINDGIDTLRLELKNAGDRIKFAVGEEITYYIDYYNGTRSQLDNVYVTYYVPDNFTVTDAGQGQYTESSKRVIWNIGTLQPLQSGRVQVKVKCNYSSESEKILLIKADIRQSSSVKDTSFVRNMIFKTGATGYHQRYIYGYPGNVFKPQNGMTRGEFAAMMVRLFNISDNGYSSYSGFRDVKRNKVWSYQAIVAASSNGLFEGYPDGTFRPERIVTRAEFAQVLARQLGLNSTKAVWLHFDDLKGHWSRNAMEQMVRLKILEGYTDSNIRPDQKITRSEAVTTLNRYTFRGQLNVSTPTFRDVGSGNWAFPEVEEASRNHAYQRTSIGDEEIGY